MVMHRRTKAALQILSGLIVMAGGVWLADATLAPQTFHERVLPRTFQNGDVFYIVPCTGGGVDSCAVGTTSYYQLGDDILILRTRILGRCTVVPLPADWQRKTCG
jgi:hypothetical protein